MPPTTARPSDAVSALKNSSLEEYAKAGHPASRFTRRGVHRWLAQGEKAAGCSGMGKLRKKISRAYGFWHEAIRVVSKLEKGSAIAQPLYQQFVDADRLLCNTMAAFNIPPYPR